MSFFTGAAARKSVGTPIAPPRASLFRRCLTYLGSEELSPYRAAVLKLGFFVAGVYVIKNFGEMVVMTEVEYTPPASIATTPLPGQGAPPTVESGGLPTTMGAAQ